jgi:branched-chain amino acid transport system permease protein
MTDILNALVYLTNLMILPGLAYASQLALGAMGLTPIFSALRFSNFAHAETMSLGTAFCIIVTLWFQQMGIGFGFLPTALFGFAIRHRSDCDCPYPFRSHGVPPFPPQER